VPRRNQTDAPLATPRGLAAYHTRREHFYRDAAMLLVISAPHRPLASNRLRDLPASGERAAEFVYLFAGDAPRVDLRCDQPDVPARARLSELALLPTRGDIPTELNALAVLANRTASALNLGTIADAAALCDVQSGFLRDHAGDCIGGFAGRLVTAGQPFYAALGRALRSQIDDDLQLLVL
jgi:hypothetical protein